jgi:hypothetical protein
VLTISNWSISGSGTPATAVTLDEAPTYFGVFSEGDDSALTLTGGTVLAGNATFSGGTVNGSHTLFTEATTSVSGLTIGGTVNWDNTRTVNQSGGNVTIGDSSGATAYMTNALGGIYDIADNSGIGLGTSTASSITNNGLFEKTGGTGPSVIAPKLGNFGTIAVTSGTLDLQGVLSGTGKDNVSGGATLEADSTVGAGQTFVYAASSTGEFALDDLDVGGKSLFGGTISGFAQGDSLEVGGFGTGTTFVYKTIGSNSGYLQLTDGQLKANIDFSGANYNTGSFTPTTTPSGTLFTYSPA